MREAVQTIEQAHGSVGVLINNAGYSQSGAIEMVPMDRVRLQFETNVFGAARLIQLVLPGMRRAGRGCIVNVSSMGGKLVFPGGGYYHATKFALEALSDALRFEVQGFGIDVVIVEPGLIKSSFAESATSSIASTGRQADDYRAFHESVARATTTAYETGRLARLAGTPEDVAAVIETALRARRPKTRYTVTASATVLMTLRRLVSDRLWDRFVGGTYVTPRALGRQAGG
jgi:NAD(P)-dependent dehydrogenase (short-subunit alcohol dehydrogenase family)